MSDKKRKYPWIKSIFGKKKEEDEIIEEVYAGPGYFNGKEDEEPEEPDEPIQAVYAGPEYFSGPNPTMMLVYAGPEYFNGTDAKPLGAEGPAKEEIKEEKEDDEVPDPNTKKCKSCGAANDISAPFCKECGTLFEEEM